MNNAENRPLLPVVDYMQVPENDTPFLQGLKCNQCGAIFLDNRHSCAKCAARNDLSPFRLADTGRIFAFSVVHRSYPGINVPFVSAIVDIDGGGTVKGNVINIDPNSKGIKVGLRVELIFEKAPYGDQDGKEYMMFYFQPSATVK